MKPGAQYAVVFVTAPNPRVARKLIKTALEARLVACGNLIAKIESHYWWQGKIESGAEALILFKTTVKLLGRLEKLLLAKHPYQTPEIIALPLTKGTSAYLEWIAQSVS